MLTRLLSTARGLNRRSDRRWPPRATDQSGPMFCRCSECDRLLIGKDGRLVCEPCGLVF